MERVTDEEAAENGWFWNEQVGSYRPAGAMYCRECKVSKKTCILYLIHKESEIWLKWGLIGIRFLSSGFSVRLWPRLSLDWNCYRERQHVPIQIICLQCQCTMLPQRWFGHLANYGQNDIIICASRKLIFYLFLFYQISLAPVFPINGARFYVDHSSSPDLEWLAS